MLDLDRFGVELDDRAGSDVDELAEHMRGATAVTGSVLATADGARAVLRAGVAHRRAAAPASTRRSLLLRLVQARESRRRGGEMT